MQSTSTPAWTEKIGNPLQVGGIETAVLDNGAGRGVRVAWVNTGAGLRYRVVLDRAMDIADAFMGAHSLAWLSRAGVTAPKPDATRELEWLASFGGGLLATCGLTHTGAPEDADGESLGLHGRVGNLPAEVEAIVQPDPAAGRLDFSVSGVVRETRLFGPGLEMRRTISGRLGEAAIRVRDVVTNRGNAPAPFMLLYHCNFGWPLVDEGARLVWSGKCRSRGLPMDDEIFGAGRDAAVCPGVLESHRGGREACAFIEPRADRAGWCSAGVRNAKLGLSVTLRFRKRELPWLTNWQHWGPGEYVTGLEPGTAPPVGRTQARARGMLATIEPGQSRECGLEIVVTSSPSTTAAAGRAKQRV